MHSSRNRHLPALVAAAALLASLLVATATAPTFAAKKFYCRGQVATIVGTTKADRILGTNKRDVIVARGGNDIVIGRGGNDLICGGSGADRLVGRDGIDLLNGGPGTDTCYQGQGSGPQAACELPLAPDSDGDGYRDDVDAGSRACARRSTTRPAPRPRRGPPHRR
jgi:Ca2+-binding RTX toxin-like protein